jgi:PKHD-type hydroxylase
MMLAIENILTDDDVGMVVKAAEGLTFNDGRKTAGRIAVAVKANDQAAPGPELEAIQALVTQALSRNAVFNSAARPRQMSRLILSRYRAGQTYGLHVDDAMMTGMRSDLSFTLFLREPDTYEGGALIIEDTFEARAVKLKAGDLFLYPSTTLHRVEPVVSGERLAVVGWAQSLIRRADQREVLFDLDGVVNAVLARDGKTELLDTLTKTRSNLTRMWAE